MRFLRPIDLPRIDKLDVRPYWAQLLPLKYIVFPGEVKSQHDGDIHRVSARDLMRLYGVHPKECVVIQNEEDVRGRRDVIKALLTLQPDYFGRYELPQREPWRG